MIAFFIYPYDAVWMSGCLSSFIITAVKLGEVGSGRQGCNPAGESPVVSVTHEFGEFGDVHL
jgi:hypothetical protein